MAARSEMAGLIALFRTYRADITSSVISDESVESIFDQNRFWLDKVLLDVDTEQKRFFSPFKYLESGFTIVKSDDTSVSPASTFAVEGVVTFNTAQTDTLYIRGWAHNFFWTLALAMRTIAGSDDQWSELTRGRVTLKRKDYLSLADGFERMGHIPRTKHLQRGG